MSLTRNFDKLNQDKAGSESEPPKPDDDKDIELYLEAGHVRNLDFVQVDGQREFLNYAFVTSCKLAADKASIILNYSTGHEVTLKGRNLDILYDQLFNQLPKRIAAVEARYQSLKHTQETIVCEVSIKRINTL